jgi:hypothetical protein
MNIIFELCKKKSLIIRLILFPFFFFFFKNQDFLEKSAAEQLLVELKP